ncbi:hypothetical protein CC86DRAFT_460525 [Ophiobolus disseminans]|uniref:Uncharacterized protein n=1 Tax=Ophiobolus disseminans TaxID=1469910 RepID=A0A6A6ZEK0_9PLEO|nr:hypothetical protein CC86DRAFT_460525 [Ophiobolus disseminans]
MPVPINPTCKYCGKEHASVLPYPCAVAKGAKLMAMLRADDATAGQMFDPPRATASSDIVPEYIHGSGYGASIYLTSDNICLKDYSGLLCELGTIDKIKQHPCDGSGNDLDIAYAHCPLTEATFRNVINPKAGLLIALNNFSPESTVAKRNAEFRAQVRRPVQRHSSLCSTIAKILCVSRSTSNTITVQPEEPAVGVATLPKLRRWSDIAFLTIASCSHTNDLHYVLRANITNAETVSTMTRILGEDANGKTIPFPRPRYWRRRSRWPGLSFDTSDARAQALLGTPNGSGVACL